MKLIKYLAMATIAVLSLPASADCLSPAGVIGLQGPCPAGTFEKFDAGVPDTQTPGPGRELCIREAPGLLINPAGSRVTSAERRGFTQIDVGGKKTTALGYAILMDPKVEMGGQLLMRHYFCFVSMDETRVLKLVAIGKYHRPDTLPR